MHILFTGDLNLPSINWQQTELSPATQLNLEFLGIISEFNLTQYVHEPTHVKSNTLDLLCTNLGSKLLSCLVTTPGISDHYMVSASISFPHSPVSASNPLESKLYHKADLTLFRDCLSHVHADVKSATEADQTIIVWGIFAKGLHDAVKPSVPGKSRRPRRPDQPYWFYLTADKTCRTQRLLYSKYKQTGDVTILDRYKALRKTKKNPFRNLRKEYLSDRVYKPLAHGDSKAFSIHLKNHTSVQSIEMSPNKLTQDNSSMANALNSYFHSVVSLP